MRKITVVTATRAEYSLLKRLIKAIKDDKGLELHLVVTGAHLSKEFAQTYKEIENDFTINKKIYVDLSDDSPTSLVKSMAELQIQMSLTLRELEADIVVILGDRYEMLSIATACLMLNIPIAHIHGGETTEGAIDEAIRHSITKMSHLHFCATNLYKQRVIQLGENPQRVFNVGALGVENIAKMELLEKREFEKSIGLSLGKRNILVTFHPTTLELSSLKQEFQNLLNALEILEETHIIFTKANADSGGKLINSMIEDYVQKNRLRAVVHTNLGELRYLSALYHVDAVVGNSSSGIIEAPSFKIATINIGERQKGRQRASSILDVQANKEEILEAIQSIYTKEFKELLNKTKNPYTSKNTSQVIKNILKESILKGILKKSFYDMKKSKKNKILVVAVHPDDETLGCGATLLKHKADGDSIHWLICTQAEDKRFREIRNEEIQKVNQAYQFDSVKNLDLLSTKVDTYETGKLIEKISLLMHEIKPNIIYLPFRADVHSDHRVIFDAVYSCTKSFRYPFIEQIYMMETLSETEFAPAFQEDMFLANTFVNIEEYIEKKIKIMKLYKSEIAAPPFPRSEENIRALATFRGASSGYKYAESFMLLKSRKL